MKLVLFNDYRPGVLKGDNVVDVSSQLGGGVLHGSIFPSDG